MPFLLLGMLGASIPVIIHLLHRQRTQPVLWGAMQFLRVSPLQMKRKKRVDHWLLMLIRILAIAVLALLLARPRITQSKYVPKGLTNAPVDVAVVIDHSLSTGRQSSGQTVFDRAVAESDKVLRQLKPNDTFSIVLAEHTSKPLNVTPIKKGDTRAIDQLRQKLAAQKQGMTDCSIPEAIGAARRLLASGRNANKLIVVLSDQQRINWHIKDDALWRVASRGPAANPSGGIPVHLFPITPDADISNASVDGMTLQPTVLGTNRPVQVNATVSNTGNHPLNGMSARLIVNGKQIDSKPVSNLVPKTSATVRFDLDRGLPDAGSNWVKVSLNANDALVADNQTVTAANVVEKVPVLVIDGQFSAAGTFVEARFLAAAMQPQDTSIIRPRIVSISDAVSEKFDDYAVVVVNDAPSVPRSLCDRLADYVRSGHGLWIILGPRTQRTLVERDLPAAGLFKADVREVKDSSASPGGIEVKDPTNPMVKVITDNERNALTGALTRKWWVVKPADPDTQVVLAAGNGDPLVMERPFGTNRGIITVWTTAPEGTWSNWNLMPNFVPLVNETVYHLASGRMRGLENRGIDAGQPIEWAGQAKPAVQSVRITLPDETTITRPATFNNGRWILTYPDTYLPGIYRLQFTPTEIPSVYYGVNIDRKELDPTALDANDVEWLKRGNFVDGSLPTITEADLPAIIRRENRSFELWGWLGTALLAGLLIETFLTYRLIGSQKRVNVADAGLPTAQAV